MTTATWRHKHGLARTFSDRKNSMPRQGQRSDPVRLSISRRSTGLSKPRSEIAFHTYVDVLSSRTESSSGREA
jgi:hypothetical protein